MGRTDQALLCGHGANTRGRYSPPPEPERPRPPCSGHGVRARGLAQPGGRRSDNGEGAWGAMGVTARKGMLASPQSQQRKQLRREHRVSVGAGGAGVAQVKAARWGRP